MHREAGVSPWALLGFSDMEVTWVGLRGAAEDRVVSLDAQTNPSVSSRECLRVFAKSAGCKGGHGAVGDGANAITVVVPNLFFAL